VLIPNPAGGYRFLPGIEPYSSGAAAAEGFEIVHATFHAPPPWREGFQRIEAHLRAAGRPRQALCGVELRSPEPYTRQGFIGFNRDYCALIEAWELLVEGRNPVARTNVAPRWEAPAEPVLYGFSYTVPSEEAVPTFVVAGAGELRGGPLLEAAVVRPGERSPEAMAEKARYVLKAIGRRLEGLGRSWADVTAAEVYTAEPLEEVLAAAVLEGIGPAARHGVRWYPARPPIDELLFEMDARGVRREISL
jgi:hypothetical protein